MSFVRITWTPSMILYIYVQVYVVNKLSEDVLVVSFLKVCWFCEDSIILRLTTFTFLTVVKGIVHPRMKVWISLHWPLTSWPPNHPHTLIDFITVSSPPVAGVWRVFWCNMAAVASSRWMLHTGGGWGDSPPPSMLSALNTQKSDL